MVEVKQIDTERDTEREREGERDRERGSASERERNPRAGAPAHQIAPYPVRTR